MTQECNTDNNEGTASSSLAKDVHWITHATFWSQIGLGIIGVVALWIYYGQLCEMRKATNAATSSLNLTRQVFISTEAAVLQPNVSIRDVGSGPFIQIDVVNSGHIAATHLSGVIFVPHRAPLNITDAVVTTHSPSPEYQSGFITRVVGLVAPLDMKALAAQHLKVRIELHYWNGVEQITTQFCYGLTVSPYTSAQEWQDCENQMAFQQPLR